MAAPQPVRPPFQLGTFSIDEPRPIKVVIIGAGYSGITAGIRFLQKIRNIQLTIYEKNSGIGGTWFVNKYPGLACDIPSHGYQLTFAENPSWSAFYASGPEILAYLESIVAKYKLSPYIKLSHTLKKAQWWEPTGKWVLDIQPEGGEMFQDACDVLFTGIGGLSRWSWPEIEGLQDFQGKVIHSADWNTGEGDPKKGWEATVKSWKDKNVAVIGVGSSAIQIVPSIQPRVKHLYNYVKGRTWLSATFVKDHLERLSNDPNVDNYFFTDEDKTMFQDPVYYKEFRKGIENSMNAAQMSTMRGHPMQEGARTLFRQTMIQKLTKKPWIADYLLPDFAVACRRLTPGPGYLEALCEDNVDFIPSGIKRVTPSGLETVDGKHQDLDIIICATGFDTSFQLPFPFIGRGGVDLSQKYTPHPRTYMSITVDGFPNWFCSLGPNSAVGAGSLLLVMERQVEYAVQAILKIQRERLKSMEVKKEAVDDFDEYIDGYFPTSVFGEKCRSWYKMGREEGRVVALWPGSTLHAAQALANPRWEDYNYEYLSSSGKNRFNWLGDGLTVADKDPDADKTWYLDAVDTPPVP